MIKRLVIEFEEEIHRKIKEKCVRLGKPMKEIGNYLFESWLDKKGKRNV